MHAVQTRTTAEAALREAFAWDVRTWSRAWAAWTERSALSRDASRGRPTVLELGGGANGGVALAVASLLPDADVIFSTIDPIDDTTTTAHRRGGVADQMSYARIDAQVLPVRADSLDVVVTKSVLGGIGRAGDIPAAAKVATEVHRSLRPGGEYWFAENARATWLHRAARQRFGAGRNRWHYYSEAELREVLAAFDEVTMAAVGFLAAFGRSEGQRSLLARCDGLLGPAVPPRWRYVLVGVARKGPAAAKR